MATEQANYRFPEGLRAEIAQRAEQEGVTATEVVVKALRGYLDGDVITDAQIEQKQAAIQELAIRLDAMEAKLSSRLDKVETVIQLASNYTLASQLSRANPPNSLPERPQPPEPQLEEPPEPNWQEWDSFKDPSNGCIANGAHHLTTAQAFERVRQRGGRWDNKDAFRTWANRNQDELLEKYGLRHLNNSHKGNRVASFRDEWYRGTNWLTGGV